MTRFSPPPGSRRGGFLTSGMLMLALACGSAAAQQSTTISNLPQITAPADGDLFVLEHVAGAPGARTSSLSASALASYVFARSGIAGGLSSLTASIGVNGAAISAEVSRAKAAEAPLAPLASPALTGTPTAPTAAPGTSTTQLATTAFSAAAMAAEMSRAQTAEAKALQAASNLSDVPAPATARANLGLAAVAASGSASDLGAGTLPAARLPAPSTSTLGGVTALPASGSAFLTGIGTSGIPTAAQPSFGNLSGSVAAAQMPALSGDVSTSAGSTTTALATTGVSAGSYGSATTVPVITIDAKGRITSASSASAAGSGTVTSVAAGAGLAGGPITSSGTLTAADNVVQGRLTLTSGTPVMTVAAAASTSVYWTPFNGNLVPLWNGSKYVETVFSEVSASTASLAVGSCYDDFVWSNAGTVTSSFGPAWSAGATAGSNTARGSGAGSTALIRQAGLLVNAVAISGGPAAGYGTYVGTVCTDPAQTSSNTTVSYVPTVSGAAGGTAIIGLWNAFTQNRVAWSAQVANASSSWTSQTSNTPREAQGGPFRVRFVNGGEDGIRASNEEYAQAVQAVNAQGFIGVAMDAVTAFDRSGTIFNSTANIARAGLHVMAEYQPVLGLHFVAALEAGDGSNATIYYGGTSNSTLTVSGRF